MSTTKPNKAQYILQVIAIVVLILSVLSAALTLTVQLGVTSAESDGTAPTILGTEYLAIETDTFTSLSIQKGSLVLLSDTIEASIQVGTIVAFETPSSNKENTAFAGYSLGYVLEMTAASADDEITYSIQSLAENTENFDVVASDVVGIATSQIVALGAIVACMAATSGLIYFIIIPFFVYIILQLLVVILRTVFNGAEEEEDDDEELPEAQNFGGGTHTPIAPIGTMPINPQAGNTAQVNATQSFPKTNDRSQFDTVRLTQETLQPLVRDKSKYDTVARLNQEPLQPMALKFEQKSTVGLDTAPTQTFQASSPAGEVPSFNPLAKPEAKPVAPAPAPAQKPTEDFKSVMDMVDSLLNDIQNIQETEREIVKKHDAQMAKPIEVPTPIADQYAAKEAQSQEILDNILNELKGNSIS